MNSVSFGKKSDILYWDLGCVGQCVSVIMSNFRLVLLIKINIKIIKLKFHRISMIFESKLYKNQTLAFD